MCIRDRIFIDATYEGDLAAAAGVPFRVGREGKNEFGEPGAGSVYKYWHGPEMDASTFIGDNAVQAYNYRLCLTKNPDNKVPITKPKNYDRNDCLLYTSPSPRDRQKSRMPSSA